MAQGNHGAFCVNLEGQVGQMRESQIANRLNQANITFQAQILLCLALSVVFVAGLPITQERTRFQSA